mmetsp:Transcript_3814/g.5786  ORF Transcript_3814/g.5786 Transcript_3814/m.5786 type:complete len:153 (+) Transcript_3814:38-496(+)
MSSLRHLRCFGHWYVRSVGKAPVPAFSVFQKRAFSLVPTDQEQEAKAKAADKAAKLGIAFTCAKCETRCTKFFSRVAYEEGVVLCRCPGCQKYHLIADNLKWFGDEACNIEDIMREKGESFKRVPELQFKLAGGDTIDVSPHDLKPDPQKES